MTTIIIFWAAILTITFFILCVCFNALITVFYALADTVYNLRIPAVVTGLIVFGTYLLYKGIRDNEFVKELILTIIVFAIAFALIGWVGEILLVAATTVVSVIIGIVCGVLIMMNDLCSCLYNHFLHVIVNQIIAKEVYANGRLASGNSK